VKSRAREDKFMENSISTLVTSFLQETGLSVRSMADEINCAIGLPDAITYQTVQNWTDGKVGLNSKSHLIMVLLFLRDHGHLRDLALSVLEVMKPDTWGRIDSCN
jgi:hypothetical protein